MELVVAAVAAIALATQAWVNRRAIDRLTAVIEQTTSDNTTLAKLAASRTVTEYAAFTAPTPTPRTSDEPPTPRERPGR
jgi:hypothetical protein